MSNNKISVITTSYSNSKINDIISNISLQSHNNIEIVIVDSHNSFNENRKFYFHKNIFINIFKLGNIISYYDSLKFGLMQATGDFIVFNTKECLFDDTNFFENAIKVFSRKNMDIVFGDTEIVSMFNFYVKKYKFKDFYSSGEFISEWENLRMIFADYFDLNSFIFKKNLLFKAEAFSSNFSNALSLDISTLLKTILISKSICHLKINAVKKFIIHINKKEYNTKDLTEQVNNHFAISFDIKKFAGRKKINIENINKFLNKYADYAFNSIYFDYFFNYNNEIFCKIINKHNLNNRKIYIYGKGWIGLELEEFLNKNNIFIEQFIDDYRTGKDIITFEKFKQICSDKDTVIIATYKYKDAFNIYKKLSKIKSIEIIDLLEKEIE